MCGRAGAGQTGRAGLSCQSLRAGPRRATPLDQLGANADYGIGVYCINKQYA
ncbi:hypothetical protein D554_3076 [Bordetella holmesii 30539]|uniref:Uncharacterized protein n=2 Tax=Bordetella holmesii TaxID=35814 RepID=A0A158M8A5_9BORD|nr:hypothetical protein D560_3170 [Bordetella holmesii ATCC 51541]AIT27784.1 hypothetical protein D558_3140 [Bordetella holmesii 44057]EWM40559.1 hypothetical protein D555_3200 [Bordetella holmesii 35009]EWM49367.1 hypothetical protein D557_2448 [Bordetella holmesii 70147]EXF87803.1 hypothetical protein D554_3076 [Bordetella holmesii 30539]EXX93801.1 hypothetical protein D559_1206 [Bordetella holmesii 1058]KAK77202.1 hypothetical protein L503_0954 [Bordetella holmesii CDC-H809-BH]KAK77979.1 